MIRRRYRIFVFTLFLIACLTPTSLFAQGGPLRITTTELPPGPVSLPYSVTVTGAGGVRPYAFTATGLPAGLSINLGSGVISGTPTVSGSFQVSVTLRDLILSSDTDTFTLVINPYNISTASLPNGSVGVAYAQTLATTGAIPPVNWGIQSGSLPPGLNLSTAGNLTGSPTTVGTSNFTVRATDSANRTTTKAFTIGITPALSISSLSVPNGVVGVAYSTTIASSGGNGPFTWSVVSGSLPNGLSLSGAGVLSGTPSAAASADVGIQVRDSSSPPQTATRTFNVRIDTALTLSSGPALPGGIINQAYSFQLQASGGRTPYSWSLDGGVMPNGLTLNSAGTITGTPTVAGNFNFTVAVADSATPAQRVTRTVSVAIGGTLNIVSQSPLPNGAVGVPYSVALSATGGVGQLTWSVANGQLPFGTTLAANGTLSGTPSSAGTFTFTARVADTAGQAVTRAFTIDVQILLTITTSSPLPNATRGIAYSLQLQASLAGPLVWATVSGSLPPGITLSPGGVVIGTPSSAGTFNFTVEVQGGSPPQTARQSFQIVVAPGVSVTTSSLISGTVASGYAAALSATGGTAPYTWTVSSGSLPGGLTLSGAGIISGTPTQAGNSSFTVRVTDQLGGTATRALSISVSSVGEGFLVLSGMPAIVNPTAQAPITLSLRSPSGASLSGTLTLSFASNAIVPGDDAVVAFSNGSRSVRFNIAANTTNASFPSQTLLLTGTVAGTISFNASIDGSPGTVAVGSILIQPVTPHLSDVRATRAPGSLRVEVSGYSAERRVSTVEFTFDVRVNGQIEKVVLTRNVEAEFDAWYRSAAANPFGSAFLFAQTFNVDGDVNIVESVTVRLANGQGIGGSQPATFGN